MIKKVRLLFNLCVLMLGFVFAFYKSEIVRAAGVNITLSANNETVVKGETITVSITLSSELLIGDFETFLSYNSDVLEFVEGASFIAGGEGLLKLSDTNVLEGDKIRKYAIEFKAKELGSSEISINDKPSVYDYENNTNMSVSSNRINIEVNAKREASNNASLASLKISPAIDDFKFDSETTNYNLLVDNQVEKLIISAKPADELSTVSIDGDINLKEGLNLISLVVKAEAGNVKTYILQIERKEGEKEEANEDETEKEEGNFEDVNLEVEMIDSEIYIKNSFKFKVVTDQEVDIPKGYIKTSIILDGVTIPAYTKIDKLDSDFILLYCINSEGKEEFYQYDRVENTLQRYNKEDSDKNISKVVIAEDEVPNSENSTLILGIIIGILGLIIVVLGVILIRIYLKKEK